VGRREKPLAKHRVREIYPPQIRPDDLRHRVRVSHVDGPDPRARADIEDALRVVQRRFVELSGQYFEEDLMVEIETTHAGQATQ
jgi:hypothetical protein